MSTKKSVAKGKEISRRTFLKMSAHGALLFGGATSGNANAVRDLESQSHRSAYGSGGYGEGEYPARIALYLPSVTKEGD